MVQESEWLRESHSSVLWGSRSWKNIYKVRGYFQGTIGDANEEINQFISN